ncbi:MAG: hypothetical protein Marn2KO_36690 [Marinobacter nauticus]
MVVVNEVTAEDAHTTDDLEKLSRPDHSKAINNLLESYRRVFASDIPKGTPPVRNGHEFEIELEEGTKPIFRPMYKLSPAELTEVKKQLDYMLDRDIIRPSKSPWGAPILFANKKDGGLRFCIDYRWINQRTIKNRYPLPLPEELLDRFHGAKVFSRLDLRSGYWQMPVRAEDQEKTAFRTRYGHYEYKVVPFGLTNAPPQFMAMVNDLFRDFHDQFMVVFLDDIIVYSRTEEEHAEHLRLVLDKLAEHNLFAKASKCAIAVSELDFVGHWITGEGISPHRSKVTAIRDWEPLTSVAEVRSFLGMVSYYRRFIREYSRIAAPIQKLVKKDQAWEWGPEQEAAFACLKDRLTSAPVLLIPDPAKPYVVVTDASDFALGATLMQEATEGLQPVAFLSRSLNNAEQKYSAYERELLGISYALAQWRHYLEGAPGGTTVYTDHQPATHFLQQRVLSRTQTRWLKAGYFQSIMPKIVYLPGRSNVVADALSRKPQLKSMAILEAKISPGEAQEWQAATADDPSLTDLVSRLDRGETVPGYFRAETGILMYQPTPEAEPKIVVPAQKRQMVMHDHHDVPMAGHPGSARTAELVSRNYWWRGWRRAVTHYVRTCPTCQVMKTENAKPKGLLNPLPVPTYKWEQLTTDLVTDLPLSQGYTAVAVFVDRLTKMCKFVPCTKEVSAKEYAKMFLTKVFPTSGIPEVIVSDRDPRFTSQFYKELFRLVGTDLRMSTAHHPQSDGQSEVTIRTLENFLRPYVEARPEDWSEHLSTAEFAANNAVNATTKYSPFYLMFGQHPRGLEIERPETKVEAAEEMLGRMSDDLEEAKKNYEAAQRYMCEVANKKRRHVEFQVGQEVCLRSAHLPLAVTKHIPAKIRRRYVGPFKIEAVVSPVAYRINLPAGWRLHPTFHVSKLKEYLRSDEYIRDDPPGPALVDELTGEEEFEVESIIRAKGKGARKRYLVLWKGYPVHEATWEPAENLSHCAERLAEFSKRNAAGPGRK